MPAGHHRQPAVDRAELLAAAAADADAAVEPAYVGRDVESMIRDLMDIAVNMVKLEQSALHQEKAELNTTERGYNVWDFLVRYITPILVMIVFLNVTGLIDFVGLFGLAE